MRASSTYCLETPAVGIERLAEATHRATLQTPSRPLPLLTRFHPAPPPEEGT